MSESLQVLVVVPTYNERDTIGELVKAIEPIRDGLTRYDLNVLVVDDSSPDGTGSVVNELQQTRPWITLLTRTEKEGLGAAYKHGMRSALEMGADVIFEMDADLSHDPAAVPMMLERIASGSDLVIGSRYVDGSRLPAHWPAHRRAISWLANAGARTVLGLRVQDCSGGYRAIRRATLERIGLDSIEASGYGFQLELLYRAAQNGARIEEIPIDFADRTHGSSKMRLADWWEMARLVFSLRYAQPRGEASTGTTHA